MAAVYRYTYGRRSNAHALVRHDLLGLIDHLHFFLCIKVVFENIDLRNQIERNLIMLRKSCPRQDIGFDLTAGHNVIYLLLKFCHCFFAAAGHCLIRRNDNALDLCNIIERLQCHDHDDGRAVRVGNDPLMCSNRFRIDLWYDKRNFRVHAERARIIDDNRTSLHGSRSKCLAGCAAGKECNLYILEGIIGCFLNRIILAHKLYDFACRTLGSQKLQIGKRKITLLDQVQEFLSYGTRGAKDCYIIFLHEKFIPS